MREVSKKSKKQKKKVERLESRLDGMQRELNSIHERNNAITRIVATVAKAADAKSKLP